MELLTTEQTTYLVNSIDLLCKAKIETAIIAPWGENNSWIISAMTDGSVYALMGAAVEFPGVITLTRVTSLKARLDIMKDEEGFQIGYTMKDNSINSLELIGDKSSAGYRCGQQDKHNLPKRVFTEIITTFGVTGALITKLASAIAAFNRDGVLSFAVTDSEVSVSTKDDNGDKYTLHGIKATEVDQPLIHAYNSQVIVDLLKVAVKTNDVVEVSIGTKGVLCIAVDNATFYVMASKESV